MHSCIISRLPKAAIVVAAAFMAVSNVRLAVADLPAQRGNRVSVEVAYLGESGGKSVARLTLRAPAPDSLALRVVPAGTAAVSLEGEVRGRRGELIDRFAYPLTIDWRGVGATPPLRFTFLRLLDPGDVRLGLRVVDPEGRVWLTREAALAVPRMFTPFTLPPAGEGVLPSAEEALLAPPVAVPAEEQMVRIMPPVRETPLGPVRVEAVAAARVARVEFLLDGAAVASVGQRPFAATVDLGALAVRRTIGVRGYDGTGKLAGEDAYAVNDGKSPLAVRLLVTPEPGGELLRVRVAVTTQPGLPVARVVLRAGERALAEWTAAPYEALVAKAVADESGLLEAEAAARPVAAFAGWHPAEVTASDFWLASGARFAEEVRVELVELPVVVTGGDGRPLHDLGPADLRVSEDGRPQHIEHFEPPRQGRLALGLVVDGSGSMKSAIGELRAAGSGFFERLLDPGDLGFLLEFHDQPNLLVPPTPDEAELTRGLLRIEPLGTTALYDAIVLGVYQLRTLSGHKAIVLLTDGGDTASKVSYEAMRDYVRTQAVPLYILGLRIPFFERQTRRRLADLAAGSGGAFYLLGNAAEIAPFFERIERDLDAQYLITYRPDAAAGTAPRNVTVTTTRPGARVRTLRRAP